jgi:beta-glucosidase
MDNVRKAAAAARKCDLNIVVAGDYMHRGMNSRMKTAGENADRSDINLPGLQHELIRQVAASGKPTILILVSGRPLSIVWEAENIPAIVEAWEPGMYGGQAVAEVLFGDVNPSAKLAMSFPRSAGHIQTYYNHKAMHYYHPYRVTSSDPLWPFGHGLSYTSYEYSEPVLSAEEMKAGQSLAVSVDVTNTGDRAGEEVVQMYIRDNVAQVARPIKELKGFCRVALEPGQTKTVTLPITEEMLSFHGLEMKPFVEEGDFTVMVGPSSDDKCLKSVGFAF